MPLWFSATGEIGDVPEVLQDDRLGHHHSHRFPVRLPARRLIGLQLLAQHVGWRPRRKRHPDRHRPEAVCVWRTGFCTRLVRSIKKGWWSIVLAEMLMFIVVFQYGNFVIWINNIDSPLPLVFRCCHLWYNCCHLHLWHHRFSPLAHGPADQRAAVTHVFLWVHAQRQPTQPLCQRDRCYWLHGPRWPEDDAELCF